MLIVVVCELLTHLVSRSLDVLVSRLFWSSDKPVDKRDETSPANSFRQDSVLLLVFRKSVKRVLFLALNVLSDAASAEPEGFLALRILRQSRRSTRL